jgi:hypothetical protein
VASKKKHSQKKLARDLVLIACSVFIAILIVQIGILETFLSTSQASVQIESFVAGLFFTSVFTLAPASVALAQISHYAPPFQVALWGGLGAMLGDYIMFTFVKHSLAEDIQYVMKGPMYKKLAGIFRTRLFRRIMPLLGALIIASPLPDEIGLAMMGLSRVSTQIVLPLTFVMNFLGILLVAWFAGTL